MDTDLNISDITADFVTETLEITTEASNDTSCNLSTTFITAKNNLMLFAYVFVSTIHGLAGIPIHVICLIAFWKIAKRESLYVYQVIVVSLETVESILFVVYAYSMQWCFTTLPVVKTWWCDNYFTYHATQPVVSLLNVFTTARLLMVVAMCCDRCFAMTKPFVYKNINRKRHQLCAFTSCVLLGTFIGVPDWFILSIGRDDSGELAFLMNDQFLNSSFAKFSTALRTLILVASMTTLVLCNSITMFCHRKRKQQFSNHGKSRDDEKDRKKKADEKTLLLLTWFQTIFTFMDIFLYATYYLVQYAVPEFLDCEGDILTPVLDATLELNSVLNLYLTMIISKTFRRLIWNHVPCRRKTQEKQANVITMVETRIVRPFSVAQPW